MLQGKRLDADANATYPVAPTHYDEVAAILKEMDGNPSSIHASGRNAKVALERARSSLALLLGARGPEIVFTSGATEANNLALQGVANREVKAQAKLQDRKPKFLISATEHPSVLEPAEVLAARGLCELVTIPVTSEGFVTRETLTSVLSGDIALVAIMHGNNEMGAVNPIVDLVTLIRERYPAAHIHVDAVQTLGKEDLSWIAKSTVDSVALSAHKIGGFKGVGALYLRPQSKLSLLMAGGGQERGRRPGTENMPGIVSFGLRCDDLAKTRGSWVQRLRQRQQLLLTALRDVPGIVIHARPDDLTRSLPNTINFHVERVPGEDQLLNLDLAGIAASSGSACSAGVGRPSHVLKAMGYDDWVALNSVRLSLTSGDDEASDAGDVQRIVKVIKDVVARHGRAKT
jgi:cysteine desulfurase